MPQAKRFRLGRLSVRGLEVLMMRKSLLLSLAVVLGAACASASPQAANASRASLEACPGPVTLTIAQKFPDGLITACKAEHEDGHDQFEVKLTDKIGAKSEADVAPDGTILQIEQIIPLDKVPAAVMAALRAKYPGMTPTRAEQQTRPGHPSTYELAFPDGGQAKEATFGEDGSFVSQE